MKNINVKKIVAGAAALGVGALMLSGAMAANVTPGDWSNVSREDLFTGSGAPAVNVMVGSMAQPIDVVWAGNIAAAIGKHAHTTVEGSEGGYTFNGVTVEVGSESSSTVSGDGLLVDTYTINDTAVNKTLDDQDYSVLSEEDISIDSTYAGASTLTVYDELTVGANVWFNGDKDVKDLVASVDDGAITYTVDFDEGIKNTYDDTDASPSFKFNLMGVQYTLDSYDGTTLKLIKAIDTDTYSVGDSFSIEDYTVEVTDILDSGSTTNPYEAEMVLKDSEDVVVSTDTFATGDTSVFGSYIDSTIDVDTVYAESVKIITGEGATLEMQNGNKIEDFPENDDKLWKSTFTTSGNYLTGLTLETSDPDLEFTNDDSLVVGDSIDLPLGLGSVDFLGLTEEDESVFTIKDNYIEFTDADRKDHEIFLYTYDEASTARNTYYAPTIDDKELFFKFYNSTSAADANFTVQLEDSDGKYLTGAGTANPTWVSNTPSYYTSADRKLNADENVGILYDLEIPLYNNETKDVEYTLLVEPNAAGDFNSVKDIAIGLTKTQTTKLTVGDTTYDWDVTGIDGDGTSGGPLNGADGEFIGDRADNATTNLNYARDEFESIAEIKLSNGTDTSLTAYVDAYTGDMVDISDNAFTDTYKQVAYDDGAGNTFNLSDEGNDADLEFGYTTYGAYTTIEEGYPEFTLPEKQLKGQIFIGGGSSTETELVGATLTLTEEGTAVTSEDGDISAKLVSKDIEASGFDTAIVPATWDPTTLVHLDTATAGANPKIIVGGHLVNTLAEGITNDLLTESGQYVYGKTPEGNIVVAGWDAVDTEDAARELIAAIEAM